VANLARTGPGIHRRVRLGGFDVGSVAGRTAAENREFNGHASKSPRNWEQRFSLNRAGACAGGRAKLSVIRKQLSGYVVCQLDIAVLQNVTKRLCIVFCPVAELPTLALEMELVPVQFLAGSNIHDGYPNVGSQGESLFAIQARERVNYDHTIKALAAKTTVDILQRGAF